MRSRFYVYRLNGDLFPPSFNNDLPRVAHHVASSRSSSSLVSSVTCSVFHKSSCVLTDFFVEFIGGDLFQTYVLQRVAAVVKFRVDIRGSITGCLAIIANC